MKTEIVPQIPNGRELAQPRIYSASAPPEVTALLEAYPLPPGTIRGWYAVPILTPANKLIPRSELLTRGLVDAYEIMRPFLGNPIFQQSLRVMDVLNGCEHQCDQCFVDAALPTKMFSLPSIERLVSDDQFLTMLQPDSLRLGSSGDLLNHPDAVKIIELILQATNNLEERRQGGERFDQHKIKIITNYRKNHEHKLDRIIQLVLQNPGKIMLCISTPFNRSNVVNSQFEEFVRQRPEIFKANFSYHADQAINFGRGLTLHPEIVVEDVRHSTNLSLGGRSLPLSEINKIHPDSGVLVADRFLHHKHRGHVKVYFNPDALWLHVYGTMQESHTARVFTPLKPENIDVLSKLGFHPDFPTPPNWPGGTGHLRSLEETLAIQDIAKEKGINQITGRII